MPTPEETLRIKAFLLVRRNQVRDYLDVAALSDRHGVAFAASTLADIDRFYADEASDGVRCPASWCGSWVTHVQPIPPP